MWKTWHLQQLVSWTQVIDNEALSEFLWGFQPGKSTVTALLFTTHSWLTSLPLIIQTEKITQNGFSLDGENFPVDP